MVRDPPERTPATRRGGRSSWKGTEAMELAAFQDQMRALYGDRDRRRGVARTYAWFVEECGELSRAVFRGSDEDREREFGDVLAWLASLADQVDVDLAQAARRYADGCPRCASTPCACEVQR